MATASVEGVAIKGLVACVPDAFETTDDLAARFGADAARRIAEATGIRERRVAAPGQCASDLAEAAARRLLDGLGWAAETVELLIVVTQTAERPMPGDALLLHRRLGLPRRAVAFDVGLGCSGYVYGLWTAAALLRSLGAGRGLLVVGDTTTRVIDPADRSVAPLFGDAAAATALEADPGAPPMRFHLGSDGAGAPYLTVAGGGRRDPDERPRLFMDGTQVFAFTLREAPASVAAALDLAGWRIDGVDHLVLHQANRQMIERLARKLGAAPERTVVALERHGNTSSASIPLALAEGAGDSLRSGARRLLLSGFGVGWSWGSAALESGPWPVCETIELAAPEMAPEMAPEKALGGLGASADSAGAAKDAGQPADSAER